MKKYLYIIFILVFVSIQSNAQKSSFLILGDIHYDLIDDHDMDYLKTKPDDLRQVKEYTRFTEENWVDFMGVLRKKINSLKPSMKAVIQLGDLSEGLAGTEEKAKQMASNTMKAVDDAQLGVPWIIAKGNHDVTGPGSVEAFQEFYVPMFRKQTGNLGIVNASYSYRNEDVQITCVDPWDRETDMVAFLDKELSTSDAKFKFVIVHEPIIPVTERCWHTMRRNPEKREKLLEVIAKNKAIVFCGHLHRYSVVSRNTAYGPIVQVMALSVVRDRDYQEPSHLITEYGSSIAENKPDWQPETLEARKATLDEESKHVTFYKQTDLPGYAVLNVDSKKESVKLVYYAAFGKKPYDKIDLTKLMK
ncbi:MAG: metallophosphoesterase [Bacteroidales bacterium]|nr:metallophosphoesterase [Bacteroidales bacterium]